VLEFLHSVIIQELESHILGFLSHFTPQAFSATKEHTNLIYFFQQGYPLGLRACPLGIRDALLGILGDVPSAFWDDLFCIPGNVPICVG